GLESRLLPDQLQPVLRHEMAHILRHDSWTGLLQHIVAIVCWWNPLVVMANRQLDDLREQICDDIAVRELTDPSSYAATLIDFAESYSHGTPVPATLGIISSTAGQLEKRIRRIVSSTDVRCIHLTRRTA